MSTWTMIVPVISTGHVTRETMDALMDPTEAYMRFDLFTAPLGPDGAMIRISDLFEGEVHANGAGQLRSDLSFLPDDLARIAHWATTSNQNGWIRVDADGDRVAALPYNGW